MATRRTAPVRSPDNVNTSVSMTKRLHQSLKLRAAYLGHDVSPLIQLGLRYLDSIKWAGVPYGELTKEDQQRLEKRLADEFGKPQH